MQKRPFENFSYSFTFCIETSGMWRWPKASWCFWRREQKNYWEYRNVFLCVRTHTILRAHESSLWHPDFDLSVFTREQILFELCLNLPEHKKFFRYVMHTFLYGNTGHLGMMHCMIYCLHQLDTHPCPLRTRTMLRECCWQSDLLLSVCLLLLRVFLGIRIGMKSENCNNKKAKIKVFNKLLHKQQIPQIKIRGKYQTLRLTLAAVTNL